MSITTASDGTEIHWDELGSGSPLVLVHGITESRASWDPVATDLAADHRVIRLDLRGHGASGTADRYDLEAMALDVVAVMTDADALGAPLLGHSLGGAVVTAVGATGAAGAVVCVDQSLQLGAFRDGLLAVEGMLRDPEAFPAVIGGLFEGFRGALDDDEWARLDAARRADQSVVLGVWDAVLTSTPAELDAVVEGALAGYATTNTPYLSIFGTDPGPDEQAFLDRMIPGAVLESADGVGHYPHLVDVAGFTARVRAFLA